VIQDGADLLTLSGHPAPVFPHLRQCHLFCRIISRVIGLSREDTFNKGPEDHAPCLRRKDENMKVYRKQMHNRQRGMTF
jgi:hypothetical protein